MSAFRRFLSWMAPVLGTSAVVTAVTGVPRAAHAFCRLTTEMPLAGDTCSEDGISLAWSRSCISFSMTDRGRTDPPLDDMRDVADRSFETWTSVTCSGKPLSLSIRETEALGECDQPQYNAQAPNANTVIFVSDWAARRLPRDAFGLTLVWHSPDTGEIYDADMQINETLGTLAICNGTCPSGRVDLQNVMTHEAGHFLGLGHSDRNEATMAALASAGEIRKRDLADDDRDGLCSIYAAGKAPSCGGAADYAPDCGFAASCDPPQQERACRTRPRASASGCSVSGWGAQDASSAALAGLCAALLAAALMLRSGTRFSRRR